MCVVNFDTPSLDVTEVGPTSRKCPPGKARAADMATVSSWSDQLEHQDHGGNDLAGCREGLETDIRGTIQAMWKASRRVHQRMHTNADARTWQHLLATTKPMTKRHRLANRTEAPREPLFHTP